MKMVPLVCVGWLVASCPSWARDQEGRFLEMPSNVDTVTYDLSTVQMIQPGRFSVVSTTIDHPDVMKLELKVLDTLRTYCARPDGKYPAPADVLTLGPPDLPVESIEVTSSQSQLLGKAYPFKMVLWRYPYKRLAPRSRSLTCKQWSEAEDKLYGEHRAFIVNGSRSKYLFDCKRGLARMFIHEDDDPAKVITGFVPPNSLLSRYYFAVCYRVMHELPYLPE